MPLRHRPDRPRVFIRSKPFPRTAGEAGPLPFAATDAFMKVDVTTGQGKKQLARLAFSPMHVESGLEYVAPTGQRFACYENYWQSLKVHEGRDHAADLEWWRKQTKAHRRRPGTKGVRVLHAADEQRVPGATFKYVESRKFFYVKDYRHKIQKCLQAKRMMECMRKTLQHEHVVITDYDGPRDADGEPACEEVTIDLLRAKLHDETHPFGHGYVVAAELLEIPSAAFLVPP